MVPGFAAFGGLNGTGNSAYGTNLGGGTPCAQFFHTTVGQLSHEWILAGKFDYNFNEKKAAEYRELATAWGLTVSVITDFPSWYYPGETTLVLWTRGEDLDGEN